MRNRRSLGLAFGVALGGVVLGTLLGSAANPTMKNLPEAAEPAGQAPDQAFEGVAVYELSPYPDRYPPAFAGDAIADWAPDYPAWTYSDFGDDPPERLPEDGAAAPEPEPHPPAASEPLPPEPRGEGSLDALY